MSANEESVHTNRVCTSSLKQCSAQARKIWRSNLRHHYRKRRQALSAAEQQNHALAVKRHLLEYRLFNRAQTIACYLATDGELDLTPTIECLLNQSSHVVVPVIDGTKMWFTNMDRDTIFETNRWNLKQPSIKTQVLLNPEDVVLVPLVGFTLTGSRLGRGGGYYDRYFAELPRSSLIGIAHSCQLLSSFPTQDWDVNLDAIVTEDGLTVIST